MIETLLKESHAWALSLRYMSDEHIIMKMSLTKMLQDDFNIELLPKVEKFHSMLLTEEDNIHLLRHTIAEFDELLTTRRVDFSGQEIEKRKSRLQHQMLTLEQRFTKLKTGYLSLHIGSA